jgi:HEAT repeat protein
LDVTVTSLIADLKRQDPSEQFKTVRTLGWFGPAAAPAVPELIEALGSTSRLVRREATIALGKIGPDAKAAVPGLTAITDEPIIGLHAKEALIKINGE